MDTLDINDILNRKQIENDFKIKLLDFENNKTNLRTKRGFFFYGNPGVGKSHFVKEILTSMGYDIVLYDSGDIRNKATIESITKFNMTDKNILSLFTKTPQKKVIIMDEIDGMNNGDKGGLSSLIKLVREKKTKKQRLEEYSLNPIICIGNYRFDKKLTELRKVCNSYELKQPTETQIRIILNGLCMPNTNDCIDDVVAYIDGDLRRINNYYHVYKQLPDECGGHAGIKKYLLTKVNNEFSKDLTKKLLNNRIDMKDHNMLINETDRTSISLLFHENIIDGLQNDKNSNTFYTELLDNYCYMDYLDRITFQKQIWIFNELTSIIKTIHSNNIYHDTVVNTQPQKNKTHRKPHTFDTIRFTKILTKYSTEYNNQLFILNLCERLQMDRTDMIDYFISHQTKYINEPNALYELLSEQSISKLEIDRMYRFLGFIEN